MAFAGKQPRGGVHTDPASAGDVDLGPRVQVGEVAARPAGPVQRGLISAQLDQVARDEPGGEAQVSQQLHQQPGRVATRAEASLEGLLAALHADLHAHRVVDVALNGLIDRHQKVHGAAGAAVDARQECLQQWAILGEFEVGRELFA